MVKNKLIILASLLLGLQSGCGKYNPVSSEISDDDAIKLLISSSSYADFSNYADDGLSEFTITGTKGDSFPSDVYFRRRVENRTSSIDINYDSSGIFATVLISTGFAGRLVVDNNRNGVCDTVSRSIDDRGQRYVWFKKYESGWRVFGASPMTVKSSTSGVEVMVDSVKIEGDAGVRTSVVFRDSDFGKTLRREEMPIFYQGAQITLTVWARVGDMSDSCWAFMHQRVLQNGINTHVRTPMLKQEAGRFDCGWKSEPSAQPVVRHVAVDVILGSSLFGDGSKGYSANIWTIPYIITDNDSLPKQ